MATILEATSEINNGQDRCAAQNTLLLRLLEHLLINGRSSEFVVRCSVNVAIIRVNGTDQQELYQAQRELGQPTVRR